MTAKHTKLYHNQDTLYNASPSYSDGGEALTRNKRNTLILSHAHAQVLWPCPDFMWSLTNQVSSDSSYWSPRQRSTEFQRGFKWRQFIYDIHHCHSYSMICKIPLFQPQVFLKDKQQWHLPEFWKYLKNIHKQYYFMGMAKIDSPMIIILADK